MGFGYISNYGYEVDIRNINLDKYLRENRRK